MSNADYFHDRDRLRAPLRITLDPEWRARAEELSKAMGMTLSRWIEQLIRAESTRYALAEQAVAASVAYRKAGGPTVTLAEAESRAKARVRKKSSGPSK